MITFSLNCPVCVYGVQVSVWVCGGDGGFSHYIVLVYSDTLCSETCLATFCLLREKMPITGYFVLILAFKSSWHSCGTDSVGALFG